MSNMSNIPWFIYDLYLWFIIDKLFMIGSHIPSRCDCWKTPWDLADWRAVSARVYSEIGTRKHSEKARKREPNETVPQTILKNAVTCFCSHCSRSEGTLNFFWILTGAVPFCSLSHPLYATNWLSDFQAFWLCDSACSGCPNGVVASGSVRMHRASMTKSQAFVV